MGLLFTIVMHTHSYQMHEEMEALEHINSINHLEVQPLECTTPAQREEVRQRKKHGDDTCRPRGEV